VSGKGASIASRNAFLQAIRFSALLGLFSAGGLTVLSSLVVHILFGASYIDAASIVGILAFASALLGMLSMFIYFHLARRSFVSLAPWLGVILAVVLIEWHHRSPTSIAVIMLCVIGATLMITALPALLSLAAAKADDAAEVVALIEMPAAEIDFTLVVPFFNPGSQFGKHIKEIVDVLSASGISYEIFAVSDGSTDQSEEQLADIGSEHLTLLRLDQNQGKGAALRLGFSRGRGEYLGFIDGDGDLPAYLLSDLFDILKRENPDIFFGSKRHPRSQVVYPPLRRFYSWGYQQFIRALFHLPVRDTQTGVKVIRRDVLAAVLPRMVEKRFAFDLELFVVARQQGFRNFIEMPVNIGERFTSTISLRSVKNTLLDTLGIFYRLRVLRFYQRDLRGKAEESLVARRSSNVDLFVKENGHRLRILILNWRDINHPNAGGAEVYTHNLAEEWRKEGHDVTLFSAEVHGRPRAEVFEGVSIHRRGSRLSVYREARLFYREEGKGQFDLVIDEINTRPFFAPSWVDDAPVVALVHQVCRELWYYQLPYPLAFLGRYFFEPRWLNAYRDIPTVTVSQSSKESLEAYGLKDVTVVPEGHYPASELPNVPREECPTIVFVGRLEANKRPEEAIQAFALLRETMPTAVLWVIGTGSTEDKLRLSAPEGVKFFSKVSSSEKTERLARAHALVVTSVREGWGLVVTEAAAVGTATIAYDVPGLRDSVRASGGILTAPDPTSLAMELEKYLPLWIAEGMPFVSVGGVVPWSEVAQRILDVAASNFPHVGIQEGLRTRDEL
jgi:glycosyltransferase involved in cell wall biosynthesis